MLALLILPLLSTVVSAAGAASRPVRAAKPTKATDSKGGESFYRVLDDLLLDAGKELEQLPAEDISPLALAGVAVSANLAEDFQGALAARLQEAFAKVPGITQIVCNECFSVHSEVKGGQWIVTRGIVNRDTFKRLGSELGVRAFVLAELELAEGQGDADDELALNLRVVRAATGTVLAAKRILGSETSSALAREHRRGKGTDVERREELARLLRGQPRYAHNIFLGYWFVPIAFFDRNANLPQFGAQAMSVAYRLYEVFGPANALFYGFQLNFLVTPDKPTVAGGALTAAFGGTIAFDNTLIPRIRLLALAGAFIAGAYGNTVVAGGQLEIVTRLGIGVTAGVQGFVPGLGTNGQVGGVGYTFGANYVFE